MARKREKESQKCGAKATKYNGINKSMREMSKIDTVPKPLKPTAMLAISLVE